MTKACKNVSKPAAETNGCDEGFWYKFDGLGRVSIVFGFSELMLMGFLAVFFESGCAKAEPWY